MLGVITSDSGSIAIRSSPFHAFRECSTLTKREKENKRREIPVSVCWLYRMGPRLYPQLLTVYVRSRQPLGVHDNFISYTGARTFFSHCSTCIFSIWGYFLTHYPSQEQGEIVTNILCPYDQYRGQPRKPYPFPSGKRIASAGTRRISFISSRTMRGHTKNGEHHEN